MDRYDAKYIQMLLSDSPLICTENTITVKNDLDKDGYVIMKESYYKTIIGGKYETH